MSAYPLSPTLKASYDPVGVDLSQAGHALALFIHEHLPISSANLRLPHLHKQDKLTPWACWNSCMLLESSTKF